jgi:HEAT repeat protein
MGAGIVQAMGRSYPTLIFPEKTPKELRKKPSMIREFQEVLPLIKDSLLIKIVLVLTFMPNVVIPIMNYQFNYAVNDQFASETAMIQFFGYFRGSLYIVSLFILIFVGRIYGKWGLPVALMFHPFNYMIAVFAFLFRFDVFSAMYARMSTTIIRTTINMPANSILIGLFPESYRNMVRPFLRGTIVRMALFLGSTLILISESYFHFHPKYLSLVALPFILAWVGAPFVLKSKYAKILLELISNNLLDIKSLEQKELSQIFKQGNIFSELEESFLAARGKEALWYASLLKNISTEKLDENIFKTLTHQDDETKILLIKMISPETLEAESKNLLPLLDPEKPEVTIAILKIISRQEFELPKAFDLGPYISHSHPVVRGFAVACLYSGNPDLYGPMIAQWLESREIDKRQSGIVSAGLSGEKEYIDHLLSILSEPQIAPIIPDIIRALSRLKARELNFVIFSYLSHGRREVRMAALDALAINDDVALKKAILLLGDPSDAIHDFAKTKIRDSEYQNNKLVVESLGLPGSRLRRGLFGLLETLDIREFDILMYAKNSLNNCYAYLAMAENIKKHPRGSFRDLALEHLEQKKELELENVLRVLAIHDQTGRMKTAWKGIFSKDTRQRANAVELLSDIMDKRLFNAMLPLLESPSAHIALTEGKKVAKIPKFDPDGKDVFALLLSSQDWVDVLMGISLAHELPHLLTGVDLTKEIKPSLNENILKEVEMMFKKNQNDVKNLGQISENRISLGKKILLLKEIEIFSGLSAAELAAIAAVTKELDYPEGQTVIRQNDMGETVFLIIEGKVDVIMEQPDGKSVVIDQISPGGAFGEMALIDDSPRSATIRTTAPSRFLILHKQEFKETTMEYPRIALQICSVLSRTIRHLHRKVRNG